MAYFDYDIAKRCYKGESFMLQIIDCLNEYDSYHLLRGSTPNMKRPISISNKEYMRWLSVCDGGLLFSTTLLSTSEYDGQLDLPFSTLQDYNSPMQKKIYSLPEGYTVIAILNYGDPICVSDFDSKIYLWDTQNNIFSTIWDSFADFLADEYNTAAQMIEEDVLKPVPMKIAEEQDG